VVVPVVPADEEAAIVGGAVDFVFPGTGDVLDSGAGCDGPAPPGPDEAAVVHMLRELLGPDARPGVRWACLLGSCAVLVPSLTARFHVGRAARWTTAKGADDGAGQWAGARELLVPACSEIRRYAEGEW
jgi:hypothetical protein